MTSVLSRLSWRAIFLGALASLFLFVFSMSFVVIFLGLFVLGPMLLVVALALDVIVTAIAQGRLVPDRFSSFSFALGFLLLPLLLRAYQVMAAA